MPSIKVEPTIPNYPPQGIQAQLDLLYLWNPDVANDLIEQLNKALEEVTADLSAYLTKAEAADTYATQTEVTQLSGTLEEVSNKVDTVDSDLKELGGQTANIQQEVNTLKTDVAGKVSKAGDSFDSGATVVLPGTLQLVNETSPNQHWNITAEDGVALRFTSSALDRGFSVSSLAITPMNTTSMNLGSSVNSFDIAYIHGINNGEEITIPTVGGTITLNEVNFQTPVTDDNKGATMAELAGMQTALTAEQLAAVNSGITAEHVTTYDSYAADISQAQNDATKAENAAEVAQQTANLAGQEAAQALTQLAGKQATLTEPQLNAVNSGITADKVSTYDGYQAELTTLDGDMTDLGNQVTEIQQNINTLNTTVSGKANTADLPQNQTGTTGQVYTKTADGAEWADAAGGTTVSTVDSVIVEDLGNGYIRMHGKLTEPTIAGDGFAQTPVVFPTGYTMANADYSIQLTGASAEQTADVNVDFDTPATTGFNVDMKNLNATTAATNVVVHWTVFGEKATV